MEVAAADSDERLWPVIQQLLQQKNPNNDFSVHAVRPVTEEKTDALCLSLLDDFFQAQNLDANSLLKEANLTDETRRVVQLWRADVKAFLSSFLEKSAETQFEMIRYMQPADLDSADYSEGAALKLCLEQQDTELYKYQLPLGTPEDQEGDSTMWHFSRLIKALEADLPEVNQPQLSIWSQYVQQPATDLKTLVTHFFSSVTTAWW